MPYAFRIRFHVEPTHRFASDDCEVPLRGTRVRLLASTGKPFAESDVLKLTATGYATEMEARVDAERWFDAVLIAGLRIAKGFDLGRFRLAGGLTQAGIAHFSKEARVAVRNDHHGVDVYEDQGQRFLKIGAEVSTSSAVGLFVERLTEARECARLPEKLRLACELYGVSRFSGVPRIHFLTLVSAVEAVLDPESLGEPVAAVVDGWLGALPPELASDDSFKGRLRGLKRESISRACARTLTSVLGHEAAKQFKRLYAKRSTLVHEGFVEGTDFVEDAAATETLVRELLLKMIEGL